MSDEYGSELRVKVWFNEASEVPEVPSGVPPHNGWIVHAHQDGYNVMHLCGPEVKDSREALESALPNVWSMFDAHRKLTIETGARRQ